MSSSGFDSCDSDYELFDNPTQHPPADEVVKYEMKIKVNLNKFFNQLDALRTRQKFCDLVVQVEDQTFFCHKIILAASSKYFNSLLGGDFQESEQDQIKLDVVSAKAFKAILSYMYTRRINIEHDNATELLLASDFLGIGHIYKTCYEHIACSYHEIPIENMLEVFQFFCNTRELDTRFIDLLCKYLIRNCSALSQSSFFAEISFLVWNSVLPILDLQDSGDEIVEAIIRWVNYKLDDRKVHLLGMIEMIKYATTVDAPCLKVLEKFAADCNQSDVISESGELMLSNAISNSSLHIFFTFKGKFSNYSGIVALNHKLEWRCYSRKNTVSYIDDNDNEKYYWRPEEACNNKRSISGENLYHVQYYVDTKYFMCKKYLCFFRSSLRNMNKRIILNGPPLQGTPAGLCSIQDKVYLYYDGLEECYSDYDIKIKRSIFLYQSEQDKWFTVPSLPVTKEKSILVSCDNVLYLLGASSENGSISGVCRYDSRMPEWEMLPSMCFTNKTPAACECNGKIYVCSGKSSNAECYDPVANKWAQIAQKETMSNEGYRYNLEMTSHNDCVWAVERHDNNFTVNVYDPKTNIWSNFKSPTVAMIGLGNDTYRRYNIDDFISIAQS